MYVLLWCVCVCVSFVLVRIFFVSVTGHEVSLHTMSPNTLVASSHSLFLVLPGIWIKQTQSEFSNRNARPVYDELPSISTSHFHFIEWGQWFNGDVISAWALMNSQRHLGSPGCTLLFRSAQMWRSVRNSAWTVCKEVVCPAGSHVVASYPVALRVWGSAGSCSPPHVLLWARWLLQDSGGGSASLRAGDHRTRGTRPAGNRGMCSSAAFRLEKAKEHWSRWIRKTWTPIHTWTGLSGAQTFLWHLYLVLRNTWAGVLNVGVRQLLLGKPCHRFSYLRLQSEWCIRLRRTRPSASSQSDTRIQSGLQCGRRLRFQQPEQNIHDWRFIVMFTVYRYMHNEIPQQTTKCAKGTIFTDYIYKLPTLNTECVRFWWFTVHNASQWKCVMRSIKRWQLIL